MIQYMKRNRHISYLVNTNLCINNLFECLLSMFANKERSITAPLFIFNTKYIL